VKVGPEDAVFVDAYHTSASGSLVRGGLGDYRRYGHVDFYPNGGVNQPGCPDNFLAASKDLILYYVFGIGEFFLRDP
jgi:hypothetical protein